MLCSSFPHRYSSLTCYKNFIAIHQIGLFFYAHGIIYNVNNDCTIPLKHTEIIYNIMSKYGKLRPIPFCTAVLVPLIFAKNP